MRYVTSHNADANSRSPLSLLDPRVRIGYAVVFAVSVALTPTSSPLRFLVNGFVLLLLLEAARIPAAVYLKRMGALLPFVSIVSLSVLLAYPTGGLRLPFTALALRVLVKPFLVVGAVTALLYGMSAHEVIRGLAGLGLPRGITAPLLFLLRYLPTFRHRLGMLRMGMEARAFGWRGLWGRRRLLYSLGCVVGTVFLGGLDHGERVYRAMLARGFTGEFSRLSRGAFKPWDLGFSAIGIGVLVLNAVLVP